MRAHGQQTNFASERILEINPRHPLMHKLAELVDKTESAEKLSDSIWVLYDQTLVAEGEPVSNPAEFTSRLNRLMMNGL